MKCPHCGQEHPDNTKFCPETGQKISLPKSCRNKECRNFGKDNILSELRFCPECGMSLAGAASDDANGTTLEFNVNGVSFKMVRVEHGSFTMGATPEQGDDASEYEKPAHRVTLTNDYYIGEMLVTQNLWKAVMGSNATYLEGNDLPVGSMSWPDTQKFFRKLNKLTGKNFRLPTEAEWEFAARGGNKSKGYKYAGSNNIDDVAWYYENSGKQIHPVGGKIPNELGIYDMSGNAWELCKGWCGEYSSCPQTNPMTSNAESYRSLRGGGWANFSRCCRVSSRFYFSPDNRVFSHGFRLVLSDNVEI